MPFPDCEAAAVFRIPFILAFLGSNELILAYLSEILTDQEQVKEYQGRIVTPVDTMNEMISEILYGEQKMPPPQLKEEAGAAEGSIETAGETDLLDRPAAPKRCRLRNPYHIWHMASPMKWV